MSIGNSTNMGNGLGFPGVNEYVEIPNLIGNFNTASDYTIAALFRPKSDDDDISIFANTGRNNPDNVFRGGFHLLAKAPK